MSLKRSLSIAALVCGYCCFVTTSEAAEIVLRPAATPRGAVVRLGDVAEIRGATGETQEKLAILPLVPAPAAGTKQFLSARQIRDMLQAAGISAEGHRFTGATQVAIVGELPAALLRRVGPLSASQLRNVEHDLRDSIIRHLEAVAETREPWNVELALEEDALRQLAEATIPWAVEGGTAPWTGAQVFTVTYQTAVGSNRLDISAEVTLPDPVVILTTPLARGAVIARADVALTRPAADASDYVVSGALRSVEDVVGKVAKRTLREGQVLTPAMVEEPTLVRRGQTVRVVALAGGIRVTTFARARQAGTQGELIYVEAIDSREPFAALVSGVREVQVLGR